MENHRIKFSERIFNLIINKTQHKIFSYVFNIGIIILIFISSFICICDAALFFDEYKLHLETIEYIVLGLFVFEWLMYFISASYFYPKETFWKAKLKWIISFPSVIDFICLLTLLCKFIPEESMWRYVKLIKLIKIIKVPEYITNLMMIHHWKGNYHTHTFRCGHAQGDVDEYAEKAYKLGYHELGFSDHGPFPNLSQPGIRQEITDISGYVSAIKKAKKEYKGKMRIKAGYEIEYFPEFEWYYKDLLKHQGIDYLILGQHCFIENGKFVFYNSLRNNYENLANYTNMVVKGIKSGYFKYVCHPDLIMNSFDWLDNDVLLNQMRRIIVAAKKKHIPLEINLNGIRHCINKQFFDDDNKCYPYEEFFKIVGEVKAKVILGVDAHNPSQLENTGIEEAYKLIEKYHLKVRKRIYKFL